MQASALVGRNVLVSGSEAYLGEGGVIAGELNLESTTSNIRFEIRDQNGQVVRSINVGTQQAGDIDFIWMEIMKRVKLCLLTCIQLQLSVKWAVQLNSYQHQ